MSLVFIIYLINILPKLSFLSGKASLLLVFAVGAAGIVAAAAFEEWEAPTRETALKMMTKFAKALAVALPLYVLIPSQETAYAMLAAYGVEEIATNERVQELGGKSLDLIEQTIEKYLNEEED